MINSWKDFFIAVEQMRECQKVYFLSKSPSALAAAKKCEKAVDDCIKQRRSEQDRQSQPELEIY
ncbi:MAG: hypothetical protein LBG57_04455 [Treponema sp.]|jgi:hypothetical protein|nr:hypothetical protein [Treponema sp.]